MMNNKFNGGLLNSAGGVSQVSDDDMWFPFVDYLNRDEVRKALFIPDHIPAFEFCNMELY